MTWSGVTRDIVGPRKFYFDDDLCGRVERAGGKEGRKGGPRGTRCWPL